MWHEALVLFLFFAVAFIAHAIRDHYNAWKVSRALTQEYANDLNVFSPLHIEPKARRGIVHPLIKRHAFAATVAFIAHPATAECLKDYAVHVLIYSGMIVK